MATAREVDYSKNEAAKLNIRKFWVFVSISMFCFVAGFIFLYLESGSSVHEGIKNEAYQTYKQHRQKLDEIGKKYANELDALKKKIYSRGKNDTYSSKSEAVEGPQSLFENRYQKNIMDLPSLQRALVQGLPR